jgi:broad specificity phosphatase PhoE
MGELPSHIFVVRHGNRLDAADKKWHLTSPTPYDPPLTYGGFLQTRQVGHRIGSILQTAKIESEASAALAGITSPTSRHKRYRVIIHSSPFLRCLQTSIGISSGLAQLSPDALYSPADVIVSPVSARGHNGGFKSSVLRLDSFLGEWLSPEYFESITPPPGHALMLGSAKAELLKRHDGSKFAGLAATANPAPVPQPSKSLWSGSHSPSPGSSSQTPASEKDGAFETLSRPTTIAGEGFNGYVAPRPNYAASTGGQIPEGFVTHARDECLAIDYQWDSMRPPKAFGDGGRLGEEWTAMHKRFRLGLKKMLNWYATADSPSQQVTTPTASTQSSPVEDEDVETVVVIVSHGAGCNALIGAITHQPVLMDVAIASLTMAERKPDLDYLRAQREAAQMEGMDAALVPVDKMYDIRMSASTEHLRPSQSSTPVSGRSSSTANVWNAGARGRTATLSGAMGPALSTFTYNDSLGLPVHRSTSASAALGNPLKRRDSGSTNRASSKALASANSNLGPRRGNSPPRFGSGAAKNTAASGGLWAPIPSSLRLMDDGASDAESDDFPQFHQSRFTHTIHESAAETHNGPAATAPGGHSQEPAAAATETPEQSGGEVAEVDKSRTARPSTIIKGPIPLRTADLSPVRPAEPVNVTQLGGGLGGLWGKPQPPEEAERFRDLSHAKRRWTVNERA